MSKNYTTLSEGAIRYLCGLIRDTVSVGEAINDIHLASNSTFSSVMIDTLIKKCLEDSNEYTEKLVANLSRLELKLVTSESEITQPNILYLFKPDGATSYNQYVVIEGNKVLLGTCDIDMAQYLKIADASKTYATKTELKAVTDKIGTTTLTTTAQTLTGSIEEVKGIAEQGAMLTVTKEQYQQLVAGQTVTIGGKDYTYDDNTYYVVKNDSDTIVITTTINASSTNSEVPTAKAVNDRVREITLNFPIKNESNEVLDFNLLIPSNTTSNACYKISYVDSILNAPNSDVTHWFVKVNRLNEELTQTAIETHYDKIYIRRSIDLGNTWSSWQRVVTTKVDDVPRTELDMPTLTEGKFENAFSGNISSYSVKNGVCTLTLTVKCVTPISNLDTIIGSKILPKSANGIVYAFGFDRNMSVSTNPIMIQVDGYGNLLFGGGTAGGNYRLTLSYPVAES